MPSLIDGDGNTALGLELFRCEVAGKASLNGRQTPPPPNVDGKTGSQFGPSFSEPTSVSFKKMAIKLSLKSHETSLSSEADWGRLRTWYVPYGSMGAFMLATWLDVRDCGQREISCVGKFVADLWSAKLYLYFQVQANAHFAQNTDTGQNVFHSLQWRMNQPSIMSKLYFYYWICCEKFIRTCAEYVFIGVLYISSVPCLFREIHEMLVHLPFSLIIFSCIYYTDMLETVCSVKPGWALKYLFCRVGPFGLNNVRSLNSNERYAWEDWLV